MQKRNAFSGKSFGRATVNQKRRERRRRALHATLLRLAAPFIAVARPFIAAARGAGLLIRALWTASGDFARRVIAPLARRILAGGLATARSAGRALGPILVGAARAPRLAAEEIRSAFAALRTFGTESARFATLWARQTRRFAISTAGDFARAAAIIRGRAARDFVAVQKRAQALALRTQAFLAETGAALAEAGRGLGRGLALSFRALTTGLLTVATGFWRALVELATAPAPLLRRFVRGLPPAARAGRRGLAGAVTAAGRFGLQVTRMLASILLITGFVILFVLSVLGRGAWTLVRGSALASIWIAVIAVAVAWRSAYSLTLAGAYSLALLGGLAAATGRFILRGLEAAYAAMPRLVRAILGPSIALLGALERLARGTARDLAGTAAKTAKILQNYARALGQAGLGLRARLRAVRPPRLELKPRGEEALAYAAAGSLSLALLIYTGLVGPAPPAALEKPQAAISVPSPTAPEAHTKPAPAGDGLTAESPPQQPDPLQPLPRTKRAYAKLPEIEPPAATRRLQPAPRGLPGDAARIAIVIDDMGMKRGITGPFADLPGPLTFAFLPYAGDLDRQTRRVRDAGHELFVHLPMEPESRIEDPGPNALLTRLDRDELAGRIKWNLNRFEGFVGINNHMGSRFTRSREQMRLVMRAVRDRHLVYLDSKTSPSDIGTELASEMGVPWLTRDIFLDNVRTRAAIDAQLAKTVRIAQRRGQAIAIGHNYQVTLDALRDWLPEIQSAGLELVSVSALIGSRPAPVESSSTAAAGQK